MWLLQGLGAMEILLLAVSTAVLCLSRTSRRWSVAIVPCLTVAALAPGPDPLSMLLISMPLLGAFASGVYLGPKLRAVQAG